jgi:hypothetical protein
MLWSVTETCAGSKGGGSGVDVGEGVGLELVDGAPEALGGWPLGNGPALADLAGPKVAR